MFCRNCAEILTDTEVVCPRCGFAAGTGHNFCAFCGTEIMVGSVVCEVCGNPIPQDELNQALNQQNSFGQSPYGQPPYGQPQYGQPPYNQPYPTQYPQGGQMYPPRSMGQSMYPQQQFEQPRPAVFYTPAQQRSRIAAGLLAIFLGSLGVHNFYLHNTGKGMAQLLMTVCTCGMLGVASEIWSIVEAILIFTGSIDSDGLNIPLKD